MRRSITHTAEYYEAKRLYIEKKTKTCIKCQVEKDKKYFSTDRQHRDGKHPICSECKAEIHRELYKKNPDKFRNNAIRWERKNPEKHRAHRKLNMAVYLGKIKKPKHCQICGASKRLDGHHWKGYSEEYIYDVQWLCRQCHENAEK